jgi:DNA-binding NarL/FixJ family response regulator
VLQETAKLLSVQMELVGTATDGIGLIRAAQRLRPDVIVTDIHIPEMSGIEATPPNTRLRLLPRHRSLSVTREAELIEAALAAGALGYVFKENAAEDLINAVRSAIEGKRFFPSGMRTAKTGP